MLQLLCLTAGLTLSAWAGAVGLGGINVVSALGQPLKAEIELVAVSKTDKPGLVARIASPDAYKGAGLDYPYGVKYSFEVGSRANGEPYLKLSSNREISDPFVSLLVELSWSSGRLMREYTFLLDPPGYVAAQPKPVAVEAVAPVQSSPLSATAEKPEEVRAVAQPVESTAKPAERAAKPVERPVEKQVVLTRAENTNASTGTITVKSGDSLNKIALQNKSGDISLERMLVALYRANADQFDDKNMNRIRSGKILRMPDHDEVVNVVQSEAVQEIHAQAADWNVYRQKLAGAASASRQSEDARQVATGKITTPAVDKTPVASDASKEVLRLSKGGAPGDKTGAAGRSTQDKRNAAAEDAIAKAKAADEAKIRSALLESNLKDMQRLAQLKSEAAALVASAAASKLTVASEVDAAGQVEAASEVVAVSEVAAASEVVATSEVAAVSEVAAASAVKATPLVVEEPSLMAVLMASPLLMGIGSVALLALGGLGIALKRRKQIAVKSSEGEVSTTTGQLTTPVVPSPETGDFTAAAISAQEATPHPDDVDPISEAELFLNFGRDEQAEEVLKDALHRAPDNHQVHLKLLGIYAKRQDAAAFSEIARLLEKTGDVAAIEQAEVLAQQLEPAASIEEADSATQFTAAFDAEPDRALVELPVEADIATTESEHANIQEEAAVQVEAIDFDVTAPLPAQAVDFDVTSTSPLAAEVLDFDIANHEPETADLHEDETLPSLDDLIFDVTSAHEAIAEVDSSAGKMAEDDDGMEFTLDFPLDEIAEKTVVQAPAINLADISLDMDDVSEPVAEPVSTEKSEQWHEVATKLDLARAYQEMGDEVGSREILDEVMLEGDAAQQSEAQLLIKQLT